MKRLISLVFLGVLIGQPQADEFRLNFSSDIINSAQPSKNGQDASSLTNLEKRNNASAPIIRESKFESREVKAGLAEKTADKPAFQSRMRENLRFPQKDGVLLAQETEFSPVQKASADSFSAQFGVNTKSYAGFFGNGMQPVHGSGVTIYDQLHQDVRILVDDDLYARMVWAYMDIKELDNWVHAAVDQSGLFSQSAQFLGLNEQLLAGFTVLGHIDASNQRRDAFNDWQKGLQSQQVDEVQSVIKEASLRSDSESQGLFFSYLKYFTPLNVLYLVGGILAVYYSSRFFRFMIRQQ